MAPATLDNAELISLFSFRPFLHRRFLLRLAGVVRRRRRCEWCRWVRKPIANPFLSLARAAVAGVAGDELENPLGVFVGRAVLCRASLGHKTPSLLC